MRREGRMSEWVKVADAGEIPVGEMVSFTVGNRTVAVANVDGDLQAFDDVCTHHGCSLSEGELEGTTVECPCHGARFDVITGEVVAGPASEPVDVFEVVEADGEIRIRTRNDD
jgi:nitrite reductase/ring-hydroxylating ferredoxin subunit